MAEIYRQRISARYERLQSDEGRTEAAEVFRYSQSGHPRVQELADEFKAKARPGGNWTEIQARWMLALGQFWYQQRQLAPVVAAPAPKPAAGAWP